MLSVRHDATFPARDRLNLVFPVGKNAHLDRRAAAHHAADLLAVERRVMMTAGPSTAAVLRARMAVPREARIVAQASAKIVRVKDALLSAVRLSRAPRFRIVRDPRVRVVRVHSAGGPRVALRFRAAPEQGRGTLKASRARQGPEAAKGGARNLLQNAFLKTAPEESYSHFLHTGIGDADVR